MIDATKSVHNIILKKEIGDNRFLELDKGGFPRKTETYYFNNNIDNLVNIISEVASFCDQYGGIFHQHLVDNLRRIIEQTGAKIVISSTWRHGGLERMRSLWKDRNLPGEIIDITPDCYDLVNEGRFKYLDQVDRGHEIDYWLEGRTDIENYVIIDDDNDFLPHQRNRFVRTANNINHPDCIDIGYGLTSECANKAIRILNN